MPTSAAAARAGVCDLLRRAGISLDSVIAADALDQPGGYGWPLIERLTERVDVRSHGGGKTVSAELRPA
ncbi:hypothetical protein OG906_33675 [Streptomyces sp. NBC_01426]|uniref:hypothetical protein n=1 Tax=Streptomyces sp. NBC_01426 TaxID=2975866 RepID=UPI002E337814|nr:hypothetical protein [Streptomyces sp. NBC_01426]